MKAQGVGSPGPPMEGVLDSSTYPPQRQVPYVQVIRAGPLDRTTFRIRELFQAPVPASSVKRLQGSACSALQRTAGGSGGERYEGEDS